MKKTQEWQKKQQTWNNSLKDTSEDKALQRTNFNIINLKTNRSIDRNQRKKTF